MTSRICLNPLVITQECSNLCHELLRNILDWKSVFWLLDLLLPAAKNISIHLCCSMFMWQHIKPQRTWDRHKQRWSRPLPGPTRGRRASRQAGLVTGSPEKSPTGKSGTPMVFICHKRQKQSVRINRNGLVSKMENWITGCQEVAGHWHGCIGLQVSLQGPYLLHAGKWLVCLEEIVSFLENLSALICTILGERCCFSYLADAWDLYMFNLCQISSEHRFGYEIN